MAINQALIRPDPTGEFNAAFQTVGTAMRDQQRIAMLRQQMAEQAVQRARENKANDFKLMMQALERGDTLRQRDIANDIQRQTLASNRDQMGIMGYNAQTSRMNAGTSWYNAVHDDKNGDPFGLAAPTGGTAPPTSPSYPAVPPIGGNVVPIIPQAVVQPTAAVGAVPQFGQGIDSNVSSPNNPAVQQLLGDLTTAGAGGTPASYAPSPQAAAAAALLGPPATTDATPADYDDAAVAPAPSAPVDNTPPPIVPEPVYNPGDTVPPPPGVTGPTGPAGAAPAIPAIPEAPVSVAQAIPPTPVDPSAGLLPPPVLPDSFASTDLTKETQSALFNLRRTQDELTKEATLEARKAARYTAAMPQVSARNKPLYQAAIEEAETKSMAAAGAANEAESRAKVTEEQMGAVKTRQKALAAIADLDDVLPSTDRAQIAKLAADPVGGGQADKFITDLAAYSKVRQELGLNHKSKGLQTAQRVARTGANLLSAEGRKEEAAWREHQTAQDMLKTFVGVDTSAMTPEEVKDMEKEKDLWRKQRITNQTQAKAYEARRQAALDAVKEDTADERMLNPTPIEGARPGALDRAQNLAFAAGGAVGQLGQQVAAQYPALAAQAAGTATPGQPGNMLPSIIKPGANTSMTPEKQAEANTFWNEGKRSVSEIGQLSRVPYEDLQVIIADQARPDRPSAEGGRFADFTLEERQRRGIDRWGNMPTYTEQKAKEIAASGKFNMPKGADDRLVRGRFGEVTVKDFLIEAAKEEKARRDAAAGRAGRAAPSAMTPDTSTKLGGILSNL